MVVELLLVLLDQCCRTASEYAIIHMYCKDEEFCPNAYSEDTRVCTTDTEAKVSEHLQEGIVPLSASLFEPIKSPFCSRFTDPPSLDSKPGGSFM